MRLIDADELKLSDFQDFSNTDVMCAINDSPTINVVKHGEWKINSDGYYPYCSGCKQEPKSGIMTKYCPNCGTKMDE